MSAKQAIKTQINEFFGIKHPWDGISIPPRYDLNKEGVYRNEMRVPKEGGEPVEVEIFISAPIWVRSYSVNGDGRWYANVEFIDRMDFVRAITIAVSRLYGKATSVASELVGQGHYIGYDTAPALAKYLLAFRSPPIEVEPRKSEAEQVIDNVREFILRNEDRFQAGGAFPVRSRAGYRYKEGDRWSFTSAALREASGCHSAVKAARVLAEAGYLFRNDAGNTVKCPTPDGHSPRMYVVIGYILESDTPALFAKLSPQPPLPENPTWAAESRTTSGLAQVTQVTHVGGEASQVRQDFATGPLPNIIDDGDLIAIGYKKEVVSESDMSMSMLEKAEADEVIERVDEWCEFLEKKGYKMSRVIDLRRRSESDPMSVRSLLVSAGFF